MRRPDNETDRQAAQINSLVENIKRVVPMGDHDYTATVVLRALTMILPCDVIESTLINFLNQLSSEIQEQDPNKRNVIVVPVTNYKELLQKPLNQVLLRRLELKYNFKNRTVTRHENSIKLTQREEELFTLLLRLLDDELLSVKLLEDWAPDSKNIKRLVESIIFRLKNKLETLTTPEERAAGKKLTIRNIQNRGYELQLFDTNEKKRYR